MDECFQGARSNSSFNTKPCACVSVALLAGIISWSVNATYGSKLILCFNRLQLPSDIGVFSLSPVDQRDFIRIPLEARIYVNVGTSLVNVVLCR